MSTDYIPLSTLQTDKVLSVLKDYDYPIEIMINDDPNGRILKSKGLWIHLSDDKMMVEHFKTYSGFDPTLMIDILQFETKVVVMNEYILDGLTYLEEFCNG